MLGASFVNYSKSYLMDIHINFVHSVDLEKCFLRQARGTYHRMLKCLIIDSKSTGNLIIQNTVYDTYVRSCVSLRSYRDIYHI